MEGKLLDPALRPNIARVICFSGRAQCCSLLRIQAPPAAPQAAFMAGMLCLVHSLPH